MYFTRDPIVETVIASREGYKLSLKSTKGAAQEVLVVDAVEVVRLGNSVFFRNSDHSKSFLLPAADYEIIEVRETRTVLKVADLDKGIKIGGGKDGVIKLSKPLKVPVIEESDVIKMDEDRKEKKSSRGKSDKKADKKKTRKKSSKEMEADIAEVSKEDVSATLEASQEAMAKQSFSLIPPPTRLISEVLAQRTDDVSSHVTEALFDDTISDTSSDASNEFSSVPNLASALEDLHEHGDEFFAHQGIVSREVREEKLDSIDGDSVDQGDMLNRVAQTLETYPEDVQE